MMPTTGKELYDIYVDKMLDEGVGIDTWEQLGQRDRNAWDALAAELLERTEEN